MKPLAMSMCAACLLGLGAAAPGQDKPLKESEVTERALIEALAPGAGDGAAPAGAQASDFARGFRPAAAPAPAAASRRQSILMTFDTDSAELRPATRSMLDVVARALLSDRLASLAVAIEGHADPRGDAAHNLRLSQARAESVVAYLVQRHGIAGERLQPIGKGSAELLNPAVPSAAENRRVSIVTRGP